VIAKESLAQEERSKLERGLTMVQHDMKEIQRKLELEVDQRQKAETKLSEVESQLQSEVSARQAALDNNQQSVEKVQQLEKQVQCDFCVLFYVRSGGARLSTISKYTVVHKKHANFIF